MDGIEIVRSSLFSNSCDFFCKGCHHHVMATVRTVRQVKHGEKLRRSQNSLSYCSGFSCSIGEQDEEDSIQGFGMFYYFFDRYI